MAFHRSTCPLCAWGCGLLLHEADGRLLGSHPAASPPARSALCIRGWNCTSSWSHRDRLTTPLVRRDARLVPASWSEAVEEIADRLAGAPTPALFSVGPSLANEDVFAVNQLARLVGGRLAVTDLTGTSAARLAFQQVLGRPYGLSDPDAIAAADVVWVFGADSGECPQAASRIAQARRNGASVAYFDVHVPAGERWQVVTLAPGRFGEIALDLQQAAFDADLVPTRARSAAGFDDLSRRRRDAGAADGIPSDRRERALALARQWHAATRPVAVIGGRWLTSTNAERQTIDLVQALSLLGRGDAIVAAVGEANSWGVLDVVAADAAHPSELACREEDLDVLFVVGDDLIRRSPRPVTMAESLSRLGTVVVIDRFLTDTTPFAHVVLPSCGFGEVDGSVTNVFGEVQRWRRAVAPPGECVPERVWMSRIEARVAAGAEARAAGRRSARAFAPAGEPSAPRGWFEALQQALGLYRDVPAAKLFGEGGAAGNARSEGEIQISFAGVGAETAPLVEPSAADDTLQLHLVLGAQPANWSTGVIGQRDEILRREVIESTLAASPSTLEQAGVKAGWPAKVIVPGAEATVTMRSDNRLPAGVVVLVPLAGSSSAALRGCRPDALGRTVGLQPVPARIEPV